MWDVHGGYTDALTTKPHEFCFLRQAGARADLLESDDLLDKADLLGSDDLLRSGIGRLGSARPPNLREVSVEEVRDDPPDVVVAQRPAEVRAIPHLLGRRPGRDVGAVYLEHNTPKGDVPETGTPWPISVSGSSSPDSTSSSGTAAAHTRR